MSVFTEEPHYDLARDIGVVTRWRSSTRTAGELPPKGGTPHQSAGKPHCRWGRKERRQNQERWPRGNKASSQHSGHQPQESHDRLWVSSKKSHQSKTNQGKCIQRGSSRANPQNKGRKGRGKERRREETVKNIVLISRYGDRGFRKNDFVLSIS